MKGFGATGIPDDVQFKPAPRVLRSRLTGPPWLVEWDGSARRWISDAPTCPPLLQQGVVFTAPTAEIAAQIVTKLTGLQKMWFTVRHA